MTEQLDTFDFRKEMALVPTPVEQLIGRTVQLGEGVELPVDRLDTQEMEDLHGRLLQLYQQELMAQDVNRQEMAVDAAFYDGKQWTAEDAREMEKRGQVPIVYNQIKPVINWLTRAWLSAMRSRLAWAGWKTAYRTAMTARSCIRVTSAGAKCCTTPRAASTTSATAATFSATATTTWTWW